jgi:hypothetical protein
VVSVLATGPKVRGFKPGRGRWILRVIKYRSTTSFGGEVKPSVPCRRFTSMKGMSYKQNSDPYFSPKSLLIRC